MLDRERVEAVVAAAWDVYAKQVVRPHWDEYRNTPQAQAMLDAAMAAAKGVGLVDDSRICPRCGIRWWLKTRLTFATPGEACGEKPLPRYVRFFRWLGWP